MFEHYRQPLLPKTAFFKRMLRCIAAALGLLTFNILVGTIVLYFAEHFSWMDAFLNSVLIMTGLGLVNVLNTPHGKLFTAFYALFSALVFYTTLAIIVTPLLHRLLHHLHLDIESKRRSE
jgi:hypothetical protein